MNFILASGNKHKAEELQKYFESTEISIEQAQESLEVVEDGSTFEENALKKAEKYYQQFKKPVLSDDSGLVLEAKPELLGIHSARFAPEHPDYKDKNKKLLEIYQGESNRNAYFVCVLCAYLSPQEIYFFEGRVRGQIAKEILGEQGFGYDPVFLPEKLNGESLAQRPDWKADNSHRGKALQQLTKFF